METQIRNRTPEPPDDAAESTQFRSHQRELKADDRGRESGRTADSYHGAKSLRSRAPQGRGGLTRKIAVPVIAAMLLCSLAALWIVRNRFSAIQLGNLKTDAANLAYVTGLFGHFIIAQRNGFLAANPDYSSRGEWRTGDHWLIAHDYVGEKEWVELTGFKLSELAPIQVLERAAHRAILASLDEWLNLPENTDIAAVHLLGADGGVLAESRSRAFSFDIDDLRAHPLAGERVDVGVYRIIVDYVADIEPEPLVRGVARIMSAEDPDRLVGSAVVILRTSRYTNEQHAFFLLLLGIIAATTAFMLLASWYVGRKVTAPMRRLAVDMQAMAEGDFSRRAGQADAGEVGLLAQAFNSMAERLRVARANEKETSRLESDLAIARSIQINLLPPQTPRVRGLDIFTAYRPAKEIGGDYYDFLPVDSQHMGIAVADASGKSIPAALVMSTTRAILRFVAPGNNSAAETLTRVNAILSVDIPKGMFVTAYYLILDPLDNSMLCASAGHTPLLIAREDGSVELVNPGGIALGFDNGPIFQRSIREQRVKLEKGDRALLYTDGVVECVNTANEEYSDRRLREFLRRNRELTSHDFVGALLADLDRHRGAADMRDDTTIVTFKTL